LLLNKLLKIIKTLHALLNTSTLTLAVILQHENLDPFLMNIDVKQPLPAP
jgi:hypothetical protein